MSDDHTIMSDWYRKLALGLLIVLIGSAAGQWFALARWTAQIDERHAYYDATLQALQLRGLAADNAGPRISVLESQFSGQTNRLLTILDNVQRMNDKLDRVIERRVIIRPARPGQD